MLQWTIENQEWEKPIIQILFHGSTWSWSPSHCGRLKQKTPWSQKRTKIHLQKIKERHLRVKIIEQSTTSIFWLKHRNLHVASIIGPCMYCTWNYISANQIARLAHACWWSSAYPQLFFALNEYTLKFKWNISKEIKVIDIVQSIRTLMIGIPNHYTGQSTAHIAHGKAHDKSIFQEFRLSTWKRTKAKQMFSDGCCC